MSEPQGHQRSHDEVLSLQYALRVEFDPKQIGEHANVQRTEIIQMRITVLKPTASYNFFVVFNGNEAERVIRDINYA